MILKIALKKLKEIAREGKLMEQLTTDQINHTDLEKL
jgi:hypothetical protein